MENLSITSNDFEAVWNADGGFKELHYKDERFTPATSCSFFELNGEPARATLSDDGKGFRLESSGVAGLLAISSGREVRLHLDSEGEVKVEKVGLVLSFPEEVEFHLAEHRNTGRLLDRDMPNGESYETKLTFNFLVIRYKGMWVRFRTDNNRLGSAEVLLFRHPSLYTRPSLGIPKGNAAIGVYSSLEVAMADYQGLLEKRFGIRKMADQERLPEWVRNVKLILTVDMADPSG